jgi:enediyne biosynthesis thioesterase
MRAYEYTHIVGFEETNLLGNVYYVNQIRWQGECRERFLREHVPEILSQFNEGLSLATTRCSCEYHAELFAFDEIVIRMRLGELTQMKMVLLFDYYRRCGDQDQLVARGEQQIVCMRREGDELVPAHIPERLREALRRYE